MHMRMVVEVLSPGMEHGDGADLGAQMPGIGSNQAQGVGGRLEQQPIDELLAVKGDLTKRGRQGEDQMKIGHRQQLGLALDQPLDGRCPLTLRAVPVAAGIVSDADLAAALTCSMWPPKAAVRQASMAAMTRRWSRLR